MMRLMPNDANRSPITALDITGAQALVTEALSRRFFKNRFEMTSDAGQRDAIAGGARAGEA